MKKNLRIVSAAAAALLAVAPVAASAVNVNADVTSLGAPTNTSTEAHDDLSQIKVVVTLKNDKGQNIAYGDKLSDVKSITVTATQNGKTLTVATVKMSDVTLSMNNNEHPDSNATFVAGNTYGIKINNNALKITGLTTSETGKYIATGNGKFNDASNGVFAGDLEHGVTYTDSFKVFDPNDKTVPYFVNHGTSVQIANNGTVSTTKTATNNEKLSDILDAANGTVDPKKGSVVTDYKDLKNQLINQKITVNGDNNDLANNTISIGNDKNFTVTLTAQNQTSGKTSTVKVIFKSGHTDENAANPVIYFFANGNTNDFSNHNATAIQMGSRQLVRDLPVITLKGSANAQFKPTDFFKAAINFDNATLVNSHAQADIWTNDFTVESNNVDASKEGLYHVTVSARNNDGKTTKVTVPVVVVGNADTKIATIKNTPGYPVTVYNILDGSTVKSANNYDFLYNGYPVKTFETKTVDGKSYTRIQDTEATHALFNDNNAWVESDKLSNYKPDTEESKSTRIMYKSAVYNKKMENTHETISGYDYKDLVVDKDGNLKEFNLNGNKMYKIANKDQYVRVRNVTGSKMTLKHNAYVYKSNGKRANKKVYKKGQTITVYGGQYKAIKKYKGKAVRIGVNRYVKLANVNYKLYK